MTYRLYLLPTKPVELCCWCSRHVHLMSSSTNCAHVHVHVRRGQVTKYDHIPNGTDETTAPISDRAACSGLTWKAIFELSIM